MNMTSGKGTWLGTRVKRVLRSTLGLCEEPHLPHSFEWGQSSNAAELPTQMAFGKKVVPGSTFAELQCDIIWQAVLFNAELFNALA